MVCMPNAKILNCDTPEEHILGYFFLSGCLFLLTLEITSILNYI